MKMGLRRLLGRSNYGITSVTSRGVVVKSKAERIIADYFSKNNLSYQYEPTVRTKPFKLITGTIKPDFLLPNYGVYVEFWGLINSSTGKDYARTMRWKMAQYHRMGIKFISLYPNDFGRPRRSLPVQIQESHRVRPLDETICDRDYPKSRVSSKVGHLQAGRSYGPRRYPNRSFIIIATT